MYVKNDLNVILRDEFYESAFPESILCSIICKRKRTLIGVCYRPPDSTQINDEALFSLLNKVRNEKVVFMGDHSLPELKWGENDNISDLHPFIKCINNNFF